MPSYSLKQGLCQFGNCEVETTSVVVNYMGEERPRFCSATHAALWLLRREGHRDIVAGIEKQIQEGNP